MDVRALSAQKFDRPGSEGVKSNSSALTLKVVAQRLKGQAYVGHSSVGVEQVSLLFVSGTHVEQVLHAPH